MAILPTESAVAAAPAVGDAAIKHNWPDAVVRAGEVLDGAPWWAWAMVCTTVIAIIAIWAAVHYLLKKPIIVNRQDGADASTVTLLRDSFMRILEEMSATNADLRTTVDDLTQTVADLADAVKKNSTVVEETRLSMERHFGLISNLHDQLVAEHAAYRSERTTPPPQPRYPMDAGIPAGAD